MGVNSNWELLTPRGFRFYLPGTVGPAWVDATTTAQIKTQFIKLSEFDEDEFMESFNFKSRNQKNVENWRVIRPKLDYVAQECPILLRKSIEELFPGCSDVTMSHLTIITINQKANLKSMRWRKEVETEKLAKYVSYILYNNMTLIFCKFKYTKHLINLNNVHVYSVPDRRYIFTMLVY